jgi:hypothetical protein
MPNHWHLVLRPNADTDLAAYVSWVSNTHVKRYRAHYRQTSGHLYQGRYKGFPVEENAYFLALLRYVEANPLRAELVARAEQWRWSSLGCDETLSERLLDAWPVERPRDGTELVNQPLREVKRDPGQDQPGARPSACSRPVDRADRTVQFTLNWRGGARRSPVEKEKMRDVTFPD